MYDGGRFEYKESKAGEPALAFALAELIDNSLAATCHNDAVKGRDIKIVVGEKYLIVWDNGCGMAKKDLNEFAIFSKAQKYRAHEKAVLLIFFLSEPNGL